MLITVDKNDPRPLYLQIVIQIKEQIRKATLKTGDELPSVRELADSLGINLHTVRSAYIKLREQGIINVALGRRATIAALKQPENKTESEAEITARLQEITTDALLMGLKSEDLQRILHIQIELLKNQ
jgi:GntR family transcriptional regulator